MTEPLPSRYRPLLNRLTLLFFSVHHVVIAFAALGGLGAAAAGTFGGVVGGTTAAAYAVMRCLTAEVRFDGDAVVVRNRWRTYTLRRSDIATIRRGGLLIGHPSPTLIALEATSADGSRTKIKVHASVSPRRELRRAAVKFFTVRGIPQHSIGEYVDYAFN